MDAQDHPLLKRVRVLVVGAGFAGLGMAVRLQESGIDDFLVVERGDDVGGTWRDNTYPGATCDVPSQLYSFSFATNPSWSRSFSPQPEILAYLRDVAARSGTLDRFRFGTTVERAAWDDDRQAWVVATSVGTVVADVLVSGAGGLSEPRLPDIPGLADFGGRVFHTARWDHETVLDGRRVAVIGTGASAIQVVPEIAERVGHLDVYQRTPPWVLPRHDRVYGGLERLALRRVPAFRRLQRSAIYWLRECLVPGFTWMPAMSRPTLRIALRHLERGVPDPALRARLTPDYRIGCKRILISDTYYPALSRDDVELVTDPIARVTATGIVTADGRERPADVIVVATGFQITDQPIARHLTGREGRTLAETWAEGGMAAYKGTTVPGFPNLFQIVGPNTGLGHTSMVVVIEAQIGYVVDALRTMEKRGAATVEPRADRTRRWNRRLQRRMRHTVWTTGGCSSWYLDAHGRNTTLWPRTTVAFRRLLARFDADAYTVR